MQQSEEPAAADDESEEEVENDDAAVDNNEADSSNSGFASLFSGGKSDAHADAGENAQAKNGDPQEKENLNEHPVLDQIEQPNYVPKLPGAKVVIPTAFPPL